MAGSQGQLRRQNDGKADSMIAAVTQESLTLQCSHAMRDVTTLYRQSSSTSTSVAVFKKLNNTLWGYLDSVNIICYHTNNCFLG